MIAVCGPDGAGKCALATQAVWRLAPLNDPPARFPDGIVYHSFAGRPHIDLALQAIVRAFGDGAIPLYDLAARQALAGKQALIVPDNVKSAVKSGEDWRAVLTPLLAAARHCGVLITLRNGASAPQNRVSVEPLAYEQSCELLDAWAGALVEK